MTLAELTPLLEERVKQIPHARSLIVLTEDGFVQCVAGVADEQAQALAAMGAMLGSLAERIVAETDTGPLRWTFVEGSGGYVLLARAGDRCFLALCTGPGADLATVGYQLALLATQLSDAINARFGGHLTAARST
jgi:predicted regulator of Ras-like GTPase activity (Roadblock/LC7/MglB family)